MKKLASILIALTVVAVILNACKKDEDIQYSSDCYIKSFVLGGLTRTIYGTTTAGQDTSYNVTVSGSTYQMVINHVEGYITNVTPLPANTHLDAVTSTVTAEGLVVYAPEADTTEWAQHSSKDSLDFSQPLIFRVIASDGESFRDYRVTLSVRDDDADSYTWTKLGNVASLEDMSQVKLLYVGGVPSVLCRDAAGLCYACKAESTTWDLQPCAGLPATADVQSAVIFNDALWLTSTEGQLYTSADALQWSEITPSETRSLSLVAASETALYAIGDAEGKKGIYASSDATVWSLMDTEHPLMGELATAVTFTQANGNKRIIMVMRQETMATLDTWSLLESYESSWTLFSDDELNDYLLPNTSPLSIVDYNNRLIAFSASDVLVSYDYGITWKPEGGPDLPDGVDAVLSATSQGEYIYLLSGTALWEGRLNNIGE